jgi:hypothetical protein
MRRWPERGAGYDQLVADMIAPTPRPGHLAEIAIDDNGILLVCDSRADRIYQFGMPDLGAAVANGDRM